MGVRRNFSRGGKVDILLIFFRLLAIQRKWTYTKTKMFSVTYGHFCCEGFFSRKGSIVGFLGVGQKYFCRGGQKWQNYIFTTGN